MVTKDIELVTALLLATCLTLLGGCSDDKDAKLVTPVLFAEEGGTLSPESMGEKVIVRWEPSLDAKSYRLVLLEEQATRVSTTDNCYFVLSLLGPPEKARFEVVAIGSNGEEARIRDLRVESFKSLPLSER